MKLIKSGDATFEVYYQGNLIGRVWHYQDQWHGELKDGTPVRSVLSVDATTLGMEIERLHKRRS